MIIVPSGKYIDALDLVNPVTSMAGFFKIEKYKSDNYGNPILGSKTLVRDWFPNLILNQGMDRVGNNLSSTTSCQVGTSSTTPVDSQTALSGYLAGTSNLILATPGFSPTPPYYGFRNLVFRFNTGAAAGNLAEVGVGWSTSGNTLFSRALILDGGGAPTTITVLSDEILEVTYQLRVYPPESDLTGNVTITGLGTIGFTSRGSLVTSPNWGPQANGPTGGSIFSGSFVYNGSIGAVTGSPAGANANATSVALSSYSNGSYFRDSTITCGLSDGNVGGGVRSIQWFLGASGGTVSGCMQCQFDTVIPKDSTKVFNLTLRHSWARRTI